MKKLLFLTFLALSACQTSSDITPTTLSKKPLSNARVAVPNIQGILLSKRSGGSWTKLDGQLYTKNPTCQAIYKEITTGAIFGLNSYTVGTTKVKVVAATGKNACINNASDNFVFMIPNPDVYNSDTSRLNGSPTTSLSPITGPGFICTILDYFN